MINDKKQVENKFGYTPPENEIGLRVKNRRFELDLKVEELARLTQEYDYSEDKKGIAASSIHRYESGAFKPAMREIRLLCDALETSADWLIRGVSHELNQKNSQRAQAAEHALKAIEIMIEEEKHFLTETNRKKSQEDWRANERRDKLSRAKNPNK